MTPLWPVGMSRLSLLALIPLALLCACPVKVKAPKRAPRAPESATDRAEDPRPVADRPLAKGKKQVRMVFAGDTSLARGMTRVTDQNGDGNPAYMFQKMMPLVADADLFFLNVEMVLSDTRDGEAIQKKWRIRAEERFAAGLKAAGVNVASVANNHSHDFGAPGIRNTLRALTQQGIRVTGVEWAPRQGQRPTVVEVGPLKVGFLAYNTHGDEYGHKPWYPRVMPLDRGTMVDEVRAAAKEVDVLVVSMHWGGELWHDVYDSSERDAKNLVEAGADLIIGSGPHVAQPIVELPKPDGGTAIVAYCLGDFVFDKSTPFIRHRTDPRFLLAVEYDGKERTKWELLPMRMDQSWRPYPVGADDPLKPENWIGMPRYALDLRDHLKDAEVVRVVDGREVECDEWTEKRLRFKGHYLRWLRPRWICKVEPEPHHTVALSLELSEAVPRRGIWAHPHPGGLTRLRFEDIKLGRVLRGFAGIPDWPVEAQAKAADIRMRVKIEGGPTRQLVVPHASGWRDFEIDTAALAGREVNIVVEIEGGADREEPGFLFDLMVPEGQASTEEE